jgi:hypothetical protein
MHWLRKFREQYARKDGGIGISKDELAAMVKNSDTGCSAVLIGIIENGGITHPGIARRIAKVTGATEKQFNSMVHKKYHGEYKPSKRRTYTDFAEGARPQPFSPGVTTPNARKVLCIGRDGKILKIYDSMLQAAEKCGCSPGAAENRCYRRMVHTSDEFKLLGYTFRFADEWVEMTQRQRMKDLKLIDE